MPTITRPEHQGASAASLKLEALRKALIEGEESGEDSPLDMEEIRREAREEASLRSS